MDAACTGSDRHYQMMFAGAVDVLDILGGSGNPAAAHSAAADAKHRQPDRQLCGVAGQLQGILHLELVGRLPNVHLSMPCAASDTTALGSASTKTPYVDANPIVYICRIYKYFTESRYRQWIGALDVLVNATASLPNSQIAYARC